MNIWSLTSIKWLFLGNLLRISCPKECIEYIQWVRRVWRYQWGNQNPYIEEEQTTQWPRKNIQKDKQRSTKHIKLKIE